MNLPRLYAMVNAEGVVDSVVARLSQGEPEAPGLRAVLLADDHTHPVVSRGWLYRDGEFLSPAVKPGAKHGGGKSKRTPDIDGGMHPNPEEANWFSGLIRLERAGVIRDLEREPSWKIESPDGDWVCTVKADARYFDTRDARVHIDDWKGWKGDTPTSALKRRLVRAFHKVEIELVGPYVERKRKAAAKKKAERAFAKQMSRAVKPLTKR